MIVSGINWHRIEEKTKLICNVNTDSLMIINEIKWIQIKSILRIVLTLPRSCCNVRIRDGVYLPIMMSIYSYDERLDRCLRYPKMKMYIEKWELKNRHWKMEIHDEKEWKEKLSILSEAIETRKWIINDNKKKARKIEYEKERNFSFLTFYGTI